MKCRLVLLITALVLIMVPLLVKADSELPLDGESWLNKSLSDAAAILQNAGYTKSDEKKKETIFFIFGVIAPRMYI